MRIVVAGYGSTGDTLPLIALAAGLQRAGHSVVLVADEAAGQVAGRFGLDLRVLPGSARSVVTDGSHGWSSTIKSGRPSMQLFVELARLNTRDWIETIVVGNCLLEPEATRNRHAHVEPPSQRRQHSHQG